MNGDVLELASGERVEIIGDPNLATNTVPVRRAAEGTAAGDRHRQRHDPPDLQQPDRRRDQPERRRPAAGRRSPSICQTWQHPVQVGGSLQASAGYQTSAGVRTPFEQVKMDALQNLMDDMEVVVVLRPGRGPRRGGPAEAEGPEGPAVGQQHDQPRPTPGPTRPPTSSATPCELVPGRRRRPRRPAAVDQLHDRPGDLGPGGRCGSNAGTNVFGTPIDVFEAPFLGGVTIIEAPLLKPFTAVALTSSEVRMRMKRNEFWNPRGIARRRLRRRLDGRRGRRDREPRPPRLARRGHGLLRQLIGPARLDRPSAGPIGRPGGPPQARLPPLSSYVFPGYPAFLEAAAAELGRPESAGPARRIAPADRPGQPLRPGRPRRPGARRRASWPRPPSSATSSPPPSGPPS